MEKLRISIITVVRNGEKTIEQAIQSIQRQQYSNLEYIIVDGNSTDGTSSIIKKYGNLVSAYICEADNGIYDAMNKGIKAATGDVVAFLNCDDWYENNTFELVNKYFCKDSMDILIGRVNLIQNERILKVAPNNATDITITMPCCHQAVFARRRVFEGIGSFDLKYKICADYDWLLRAVYAGINLGYVDDIFANYRLDGYSGKQDAEMYRELEEIALKQAMQNCQYEKKNEIYSFYQVKKLRLKDDTMIDRFCQINPDFARQNFDLDKFYYIWGTGVYGEKCYDLFKKIGLNIQGFIDNKNYGNKFKGYQVIAPNEIGNDMVICVSSELYEKEIVDQIIGLGIPRERYFCFSELRSSILQRIKKYN